MNSARANLMTRFMKGGPITKSPWAGSLAVLLALTWAYPANLGAQTPVDLRVIGSGTVETNCLVSLTQGCQITAVGTMSGTGINPGEFIFRVDTGSPNLLNGNPHGQGLCLPGSLAGRLTETDGDILEFNHVGLVCEEGAPGSPYHYNGTFRITGGTGRFSSARGTGSIAVAFTRPVDGQVALLEIRGAIQ